MRHHRNLFASILLILVLLLPGCGAPAAATAPAAPPSPTAEPTLSPTPAPTDTPSPTVTPAPTPLPGVEVIPLSEMTARNPWLPLDAEDKPISVFYGFNTQKPPFNRREVRQAFAAAIDRQVIAEQAAEYYFREAKPATTLTPSVILGRDLYNEVGIPFDPERARALLLKGGYAKGEDFPKVTLVVPSRGKAPGAYYLMAKTAVRMWKEHLGVEVILEAPDMAGWRQRVDAGNFDMYWLGWIADYSDPDDYLKLLFRGGEKANWARFDNAAFNELVIGALRVYDPLERQQLYIQAERILTEDETAVLPLFHAYRPTPYGY